MLPDQQDFLAVAMSDPARPKPPFEIPKQLLPFLDDKDPRYRWYRRPRWFRRIRAVFRFAWLSFFVVYPAAAIWQIVSTFLGGGQITWDTVKQAFLLTRLIQLWQEQRWAAVLIGVGLVALVVLAFVAHKDHTREDAVLKLRDRIAEWYRTHQVLRPDAKSGAPAAPELPFDDLGAPDAAHFVGRVADLAWVLGRLRPAEGAPSADLAPLAAVTGLAGVGKTALAGVALRQLYAEGTYPGGIAALRCEGLTDPAFVLRLVLARFGQNEGDMESETLDQLGTRARALRGKHALVALDNVDPDWPVQEVVKRLRAAGVAVLLTARQALPHAAVPVEASHMLEVLSPEEALRLFAQSYGRPDTLDLTRAERAAAARIVTSLGEHTLAVKLAAANAADLKLDLAAVAADLEAHPDRGLDLSEDETPAGVQRAFALSVEALPAGARRLFAGLAAFATAEFGREAALALAAGLESPTSEDDLNLLVRRALLEASVNARMPEGSDRQRLRLHPLLRAYAARSLAGWSEAEREAASAALADYYAGYANATEAAALAPDEENITAALEWAHAHDEDALVARVCNGMLGFWRDRSKTTASLKYLPWGIAAARTLDQTRLLGYLLRDYGEAVWTSGDIIRAEQLFREALELFRSSADEIGAARLLEMVGRVEVQRGQVAQAEAHYHEAEAIFQAQGDTVSLGILLSSLGDILVQRGDLAGAQANYERYLAIMREVGDTREEGVALFKCGQIAAALEQDDDAENLYYQGLAGLRDIGDVLRIANASLVLGQFLITRRSKREEGCAMLSEAARLFEQMGLTDQVEQAREMARRMGC